MAEASRKDHCLRICGINLSQSSRSRPRTSLTLNSKNIGSSGVPFWDPKRTPNFTKIRTCKIKQSQNSNASSVEFVKASRQLSYVPVPEDHPWLNMSFPMTSCPIQARIPRSRTLSRNSARNDGDTRCCKFETAFASFSPIWNALWILVASSQSSATCPYKMKPGLSSLLPPKY